MHASVRAQTLGYSLFISLFLSQVCDLMNGRDQLCFILVTVTAHYLSGYQLNPGLLSE